MREIKFKFLMENNEVTEPYYLRELIDSDSYINIECEYSSKIKKELQYTGLEDKDSVEIYEGDIAIADCRSGHNWNNGKYVIEYDSTNCCFYGNPKPVKQLFDLRLNVIHCEPMCDLRQKIKVIGNIYENPELLKERK